MYCFVTIHLNAGFGAVPVIECLELHLALLHRTHYKKDKD